MKKLWWLSISIFIFLIILTRQIVVVHSESENPITPFVYEGDDPYNYFTDVKNTSDGGYIVIDSRLSKIPDRLIKFNANMEKQWEQTFDTFYSISIADAEELENGDFIITGEAISNNEKSRPYIVRLDQEGNFIKNHLDQNDIWDQNSDYYKKDIEATQDGGFIALKNETEMIKFSSDGEVEWFSTYQNKNYDSIRFSQIIQIDNYYFGLGYTSLTNNEDHLDNEGILVKLDESGEQVWSKSYKSTLTKAIKSKNQTITAIGGNSMDQYIVKEGWLKIHKEHYYRHPRSIIKIDAKNGKIIFNENLISLEHNLNFNALSENDQGEFFVAGEVKKSPEYESAVLLLKYSEGGKKLLETELERDAIDASIAYSISTSANTDELIIVGKKSPHVQGETVKIDGFYVLLKEDSIEKEDLGIFSSRDLFWDNLLVSVRVRLIQTLILTTLIVICYFSVLKFQGKLVMFVSPVQLKTITKNLNDQNYDVLTTNRGDYIIKQNNHIQFRIHRHRFFIVVVPVNKSTKQLIKSVKNK